MKNRVSLLLLVLGCLLALVPGASAQDTDCLNLSADDCAVVTAAEANSENIKSALLNFELDFTLGGLESFDPSLAGGMEFHISGSGPFTGTGVPDVAALSSGDMSALLGTFNTRMDLQIDVTAPGEAPVSMPFSFVIVDSTLYFQDPENAGQWVGIPAEMLAAQMGQFTDMAGAMGGMDPNAMSDPTAAMGALPPELMTAFSSIDPEALMATPGFLNYQRLGDEQLMGQAMSPFQFTADFGALFKSPEFQSMLSQISTAAMSSTDPEVQQMAQMMMILPMFLQGTTGTINLTQWVGSTDQFVHQFAFDMDATIDVSMLAAMSGDAGAQTTQMSPIEFDLHMLIGFDQINGTFEIVAPEGAQMMEASS